MIKKIIFPLLAFSLLTACNNAGKEDHGDHESPGGGVPVATTPGDSLYNLVMAGHDEVMPKMGKVRGAEARAKAMLDSLARLPYKAQDAAAGLKKDLENLVNELNGAKAAMDEWMTKFNMDSAKDNIEQRLIYLRSEEGKVTKVKEAVLNSLAKADSLFHAKLKP